MSDDKRTEKKAGGDVDDLIFRGDPAPTTSDR